jgi:hypothetical protein
VFADQYVMMTNLLQTLFTVWSGDEKLGFTVLA